MITLAWLTTSCKDILPSHCYMYSHQVWWLWSSCELRYEVLTNYVITYIEEYKKGSCNTSRDNGNGIILLAYEFQPDLVLYLCENFDIKFLIYHVITI